MNNAVVTHVTVKDEPFEPQPYVFRTYVPDYAPPQRETLVNEDEDGVETKVVAARRGRRPRRNQDAETK